MNYKIFISATAAKQLGTHIQYFANVSKNAASDKMNEILNTINSLSLFPQRCPFFNENGMPCNKYRKLTVDKTYFILFQIIENTVYIEYIYNSKQNNFF